MIFNKKYICETTVRPLWYMLITRYLSWLYKTIFLNWINIQKKEYLERVIHILQMSEKLVRMNLIHRRKNTRKIPGEYKNSEK